MSDSSSNDAFIRKQRDTSNSLVVSGVGMIFESESDHLRHQTQVFDEMAHTFASGETISDDLIPIYQHLVSEILGSSDTNNVKLLDVACGSGALWPFFVEACAGSRLDVTGVDLSKNMATAANNLATEIGDINKSSFFRAVQSDIQAYCKETPQESFQIAVLNACFGNFWQPYEVLSSLSTVVNGTIFVSHPLGAEFVAKLHEQDSKTVPNLLPTSIKTWQEQIARHQLPLRIKDLTLSFNEEPFYLAKLAKTRAKALESVVRLSGDVDRGYGRGGKKLGFPTANLPSRLFQGALESVQTGVYFGWAMVQNRVHKAVVNVGYSPTFEGQENPEKIVEAHLILQNEELGDFYDQPMKLLLLGFLRTEMKFPSFGDLVSQINEDVSDSDDILNDRIYQTFKSDDMFLADNWKGSSGNSANASWEFQPMTEFF